MDAAKHVASPPPGQLLDGAFFPMSANPPDVGLNRGHTRIAQTELPRQSVRLRWLPNLTNHVTSNHDSTVLLHGKIGTGKERSLRNRSVSKGAFMDAAGVYA